MALYRDEAIVLRTQKLGEADRIVTLLTRQHGRCARSQGRAAHQSRFGARLEPFMDRRRPVLRGPQPRHRDPGRDARRRTATRIAATTPRYTAATAMLETPTGSPRSASRRCSSTCCSPAALRSLAGGEHDPGLVLDAYLLRALAVAGWAPSFTTAPAAAPRARTAAFNVAAGGAVCPVCRPPGSAAPGAGDARAARRAARRRLGASPTPRDARHRREGSGLVAGLPAVAPRARAALAAPRRAVPSAVSRRRAQA